MPCRWIYSVSLIITLIISGIVRVSAQTDMHGTEFWCSFMNNEMGPVNGRLYFTSVHNTTVTVENPHRNFKVKVNIEANKLNYLDIHDSIAATQNYETIEKTGLHIQSDKPICVTAALFEVHASNAFVVIPLKNVGKGEKFIAAHGSPKSKNHIQLLATEDSVEFKINLLAATTGKHKPNAPFTLFLNKGETYSMVADTGHFSGSVIEIINDKKGLVYVGDKNLAMYYGGCAHRSIVTQLNCIGWSDRKYVVMPLFGQTKGYILKLVSLDSHLWVNVNGFSHFIVNKDSSIEIDILNGDSVLLVTADRPFLCFQIMKGGGKNGFYKLSSGGHPGLIQIAGSQYLTNESHFVSLTDTKIKDHFVSILINKRSRDAVTLDNLQIPPEDFRAVPDDTNYLFVNRMVHDGAHVLRSSHGHQVYAYGIEVSSIAESYFYFAGFKYPVLKSMLMDSTVAYDCRNQRIHSRIKVILNNPYNLPVKKIIWYSDSFSIPISSAYFDAPFVAGETYRFKVLIYYESQIDTLEEQITFNFPEFNPVYNFVMCKDSVTFHISNPYFTDIKWHDNSHNRSYHANKEEDIYVTARDTSGHCLFSDSAQIREVKFDKRIFIDTLSDCHVNNLFHVLDQSTAINDSIRLRVWSHKGEVIAFDTNYIEHHFVQPGKPVLQLDLYLEKSQIKCRIDIPFQVHWNTYTRADFGGERFCSGDTITVIDKSFACCDSVATYSVHSDGKSVTSKEKKNQFPVFFDPVPGTGFKTFYYVVTNDKGCKDTMKKEIIVMPKADANISQSDSVRKCMALARWNFIHKRNEFLTGPYAVQWFLGDSVIGYNDEYRNFRIRQTGSHAIKLITKTGFGCIDSSVHHIEVLPEIEIEIKPDSPYYCLNAPELEFKARVQHPLAVKYSWEMNNQVAGADSVLWIRNDFNKELKIALSVQSDNPYCQTALEERFLYLYQNPKARMQLSDSVLCAGTEMLNVQNISDYERKLKWVIWKGLTGQDTVSHWKAMAFEQPGSYQISLQIVDSMGCSDSTVARLEVFDSEPVKIIMSDSILCEREPLMATALHQAASIDWFLEEEHLNEKRDSLFILSPPTGKVRLKVFALSEQGCKSSDSMEVMIHQKPAAGFELSTDSACFQNYRVLVNNTSVSATDPISRYQYFCQSIEIADQANFIIQSGLSKESNEILQVITTLNGCSDTFSKALYLVDWQRIEFNGDTICLGELAHLYPVGNIHPNTDRIIWHSGDGYQFEGPELIYEYNNAGTFSPVLEVHSTLGCSTKDTLQYGVRVNPLPGADFTYSSVAQNAITLLNVQAVSDPNDFFKWTIGSLGDFSGNPLQISIDKGFAGHVSLWRMNRFGCVDSSTQWVEVFPFMNWYIPNAFSPGSDGINDHFGLLHQEGISRYHLQIYNRWGELIYESMNPADTWNGQYDGVNVQTGVYTYLMEFNYGKTSNYYFKGTIQVVR